MTKLSLCLICRDNDDTISEANGRKLRELAFRRHGPRTLGFVMQVECPGERAGGVTVVDHVKMFRNHPGIRFEFRLHEQLLPSIQQLGGEVEWTDISVVHSGADRTLEGRKRKYERDVRILGEELEARPEAEIANEELLRRAPGDAAAYHNLGVVLVRQGKQDRAIQAFQKSLQLRPDAAMTQASLDAVLSTRE